MFYVLLCVTPIVCMSRVLWALLPELKMMMMMMMKINTWHTVVHGIEIAC